MLHAVLEVLPVEAFARGQGPVSLTLLGPPLQDHPAEVVGLRGLHVEGVGLGNLVKLVEDLL